MIGQDKNKELLRQWRLNRSIPRFIIIEGDDGSGRLTFAKMIMKQLNAEGVISEISKGAVNETIENAYKVASTTCYIFEDADEMSTEAKNSLLKVVEEPPNKAYFIMTINSTRNMLETILSRGTLVRMEPYTPSQLNEFTDDEGVLTLARTPGDCKDFIPELCQRAIVLAKDICKALADKKGVEVLKHCSELKAKETDENKVDCILFFRAFRKIWLKLDKTLIGLVYIQAADRLLNYKSVNKKGIIEAMLINILKERKDAEIS